MLTHAYANTHNHVKYSQLCQPEAHACGEYAKLILLFFFPY